MSAEQPSLEELRRRIDEIDTQLHDLLIRRIDVTRRVGAAKKGSRSFIRPGREAQVLRRLVARHRGPLPKPVVVRVWREIFAAVTGLQGPLRIAVLADNANAGICRLAAEHFGSRTPVRALGSIAQVLNAVGQEEGTLGVLPLPQDGESEPWWPNLAGSGEGVPRVIARLPFMEAPADRFGVAGALAIGLLDPEDSGCDRSFLIAETETEPSRSRLRGWFEAAGLTPVDLQSQQDEGARRLHLIEVEGCFVGAHPALDRLIGASEGALRQVWPVGGYAAPLTAAELAPAEQPAPAQEALP